MGVASYVSGRRCREKHFSGTHSKFPGKDIPPLGLRSCICHFSQLRSKRCNALETAASMSNAAIKLEMKLWCLTHYSHRTGTGIKLHSRMFPCGRQIISVNNSKVSKYKSLYFHLTKRNGCFDHI